MRFDLCVSLFPISCTCIFPTPSFCSIPILPSSASLSLWPDYHPPPSHSLSLLLSLFVSPSFFFSLPSSLSPFLSLFYHSNSLPIIPTNSPLSPPTPEVLREGDELLEVNGVPVMGRSTDEIIRLMVSAHSTHMWLYTCTCTSTHTCTYLYAYTCTCTYTYITICIWLTMIHANI